MSWQHHCVFLTSVEPHSRWHLSHNLYLGCPGIPVVSKRHKVTSADHPIQINGRWPHPIAMSGMLLHPLIAHLWRLAALPSLEGLFLHVLICCSHSFSSPWWHSQWLNNLLHGVDSHFYLCSSPGPINWTPHAKLNVLCFAIEKPLIEQVPSKEQGCLLQP